MSLRSRCWLHSRRGDRGCNHLNVSGGSFRCPQTERHGQVSATHAKFAWSVFANSSYLREMGFSVALSAFLFVAL